MRGNLLIHCVIHKRRNPFPYVNKAINIPCGCGYKEKANIHGHFSSEKAREIAVLWTDGHLVIRESITKDLVTTV
ncbi:hypothetical protein KTT_32010 [Tengunoibacter tsumagoiensis]|uniref:Uncharacterized protein n=1 Tax=Tengunoibacter tsumagoiensis TaxID=2014871 RepID=A0A402A2P4_9CHLR|nr:hypothetical protein KTT_32010 [Tengunoibacter tsumagoiensis]